ncbi:Vitamin B12-binding protein precursor [compost metagenome]
MPRLLACLLLALCGVAEAAERVVTLAPSLTEIVVELGAADRLVGVLDAGERPAALKGLPSVGRYGQLDMERLLSLKPDLLLLWPDSVGAAQLEQLRRFGIPTYVAEPHDLDELIVQVEAIAVRLGLAEQGRRHAVALREQLASLRQRYRRSDPLPVFYQIWDKPLYTVGGRQIISDALQACGARNIFADLALPAPQVNLETVLQRRPEAILATRQNQLDTWKAWPHGRLLLVTDDGLERPSGQMIGATAKLCALIAPER